jgi:hypothetical protein
MEALAAGDDFDEVRPDASFFVRAAAGRAAFFVAFVLRPFAARGEARRAAAFGAERALLRAPVFLPGAVRFAAGRAADFRFETRFATPPPVSILVSAA